MKEVPDREVLHDVDDDNDADYGSLVGDARTLTMTQKEKDAARRRRKRLDEMGGFGFRP
jgi:hypothetical protein